MKHKTKTSSLTYLFRKDGSYTYTNYIKGITPDIQVDEYTFTFILSIWLLGPCYFQAKVPLNGGHGEGKAVVEVLPGFWFNRLFSTMLRWLGLVLSVEGMVSINTNHHNGDVRVDWDAKEKVIIRGDSRRAKWMSKLIHDSKCVGWSCNLNRINYNGNNNHGFEQKTA